MRITRGTSFAVEPKSFVVGSALSSGVCPGWHRSAAHPSLLDLGLEDCVPNITVVFQGWWTVHPGFHPNMLESTLHLVHSLSSCPRDFLISWDRTFRLPCPPQRHQLLSFYILSLYVYLEASRMDCRLPHLCGSRVALSSFGFRIGSTTGAVVTASCYWAIIRRVTVGTKTSFRESAPAG